MKPMLKLTDIEGPANLENMIDCAENGITDVLDTLSTICDSKADHLRDTWQDHVLAENWSAVARFIDRLSDDLKRRGLP
jgi:hypothetical protein